MTQRCALGSTGLVVSEVGFGCWQLGGRGWGKYSLGEVVASIEEALDAGINLFDTAPVYGFGVSEELLGKTLAPRANDVVVVTKGGLVWDDTGNVRHDASPESLRTQLEASLKRLRREKLQVYLLHWPDERVPLAESIDALEAFRQEGLVDVCGLSNVTLDQLHGVQARCPGTVNTLELPLNVLERYANEFDGVTQDLPELLDTANRDDLGVIAFDVLARGFLTRDDDQAARLGRRDLRRNDRRFADPAIDAELHERKARVRAWAHSHGVPPSAVAIRAILDRPGVTSCLVGMKCRAHLRDNLRYVEVDASTGEF
ncbi:MAG: aldo/keto reductase [Planctomycetes bacterium]|nr:aldo/keto reductase [Planctomycetota bacterium]